MSTNRMRRMLAVACMSLLLAGSSLMVVYGENTQTVNENAVLSSQEESQTPESSIDTSGNSGTTGNEGSTGSEGSTGEGRTYRVFREKNHQHPALLWGQGETPTPAGSHAGADGGSRLGGKAGEEIGRRSAGAQTQQRYCCAVADHCRSVPDNQSREGNVLQRKGREWHAVHGTRSPPFNIACRVIAYAVPGGTAFFSVYQNLAWATRGNVESSRIRTDGI